MDDILDAAFFHTNPDGSIMTRAQVMESYRAPRQFTVSDEQMQDVRILVDGSDYAIVNARVILTGKRGEDPFTSQYRVTYVLRKAGNTWKVLNSHSSLLGATPQR
jgi:ketosteroid isomerase-like protein